MLKHDQRASLSMLVKRQVGAAFKMLYTIDKAKTAALSASRRAFMVEKIVPCRANGLARHFVTRCGSTGDACAKHLGRGEMRAS